MCNTFVVTNLVMPFQSTIRVFRRYLVVAKWLLGQSVWALKRRIAILMVMSFGAYCCEFGALFLSIATIKQDTHLANAYAWAEITNYETTISISLVLLCLIIAAIFGFLSATQTVRCRRLCQDLLTKKAESILLSDEIPLIPLRKNIGAKSAAIRVLRSDPGMVGWVLMLILRMLVPLGMTFFVFAYLLVTHTAVGLLIVGLVVVSVPIALLPNKLAASATAKMERVTSQTAQNTQLFLKSINTQNAERVDSLPVLLAPMLDARDRRMIAVQYSRLIGSIILAGVITLCLVMLLSKSSSFTDDTTALVAILATIRLGMTSLRSSNTTITSINRFYTQIRRFAGFTQGIPIDGFVDGIPRLSCGIQKDKPIPPHSIIGVVTPVQLDRISTGWLTLSLFNRAKRGELYLGGKSKSVCAITYVNEDDRDSVGNPGIRVVVTKNPKLLEVYSLYEAFEINAKGRVKVLDKENMFKDLDGKSTGELSFSEDDLEMELEMEMGM